MSVIYGSKLITDGLVLFFDGANPKSYIGSGNTVVDISRSNNNGTLINSPTFTTTNGGEFTLNGTSQYISTSYTQPSVTQYTIDAWFKSTSTTTQMALAQCRGSGAGKSITLGINHAAGTIGTGFIGVDSAGILIGVRTTSTSVNNGEWQNLVGVFNQDTGTSITTASFTLYLNGARASTSGFTTGATTSPVDGLGGTNIGWHQAWAKYFPATIATVKIYTRALTADDIIQNFISTRGRFSR